MEGNTHYRSWAGWGPSDGVPIGDLGQCYQGHCKANCGVMDARGPISFTEMTTAAFIEHNASNRVQIGQPMQELSRNKVVVQPLAKAFKLVDLFNTNSMQIWYREARICTPANLAFMYITTSTNRTSDSTGITALWTYFVIYKLYNHTRFELSYIFCKLYCMTTTDEHFKSS